MLDEADTVARARKYASDLGLRDPYAAYTSQRCGAANRGISWGFTFATWWNIWEPYYHMRGRGKNGLCMARESDEGSYNPDNVYLTTNLGNSRDYHRKCRRALEARKSLKEKHEMSFARSGSTSRSSHCEHISHLTYKPFNTSKSTCNHDDDGLE